MDGKFFRLHFFYEFIGTFFLVMANTMLTSSPDPNRDSIAFINWFVWGGMRYIRPSTTLDPLQTLGPELVVLGYYWSAKGWLKILGSIAFQLGGSIAGAYLSFLFQGSDDALFSQNLTMPAEGSSISPYEMFLGDFIFCFAMDCVNYAFIWQMIEDFKKAQGNAQTPDPDTVVSMPRIEGPAAGAVLFLAIECMFYTTRGSFIITRSFGPAVLLNDFTNLGWYFLGQCAGQLCACLCFVFAFFD